MRVEAALILGEPLGVREVVAKVLAAGLAKGVMEAVWLNSRGRCCSLWTSASLLPVPTGRAGSRK
jgi:hypothetical protein